MEKALTCETRGCVSTIYSLLRGIDEWTRKPVSSRLSAHNYLCIRLNSDDQNKYSIHLNWTWRRILKVPWMGPTNCPGLAGNPRPGHCRTLETIPCRVSVSCRLTGPGPCRWGCPSTVNSPSTCTSDGRENRCSDGPSIMMPMGRTTRWDRPSSYRIILKVSNQFECHRNQYEEILNI